MERDSPHRIEDPRGVLRRQRCGPSPLVLPERPRDRHFPLPHALLLGFFILHLFHQASARSDNAIATSVQIQSRYTTLGVEKEETRVRVPKVEQGAAVGSDRGGGFNDPSGGDVGVRVGIEAVIEGGDRVVVGVVGGRSVVAVVFVVGGVI